MDSHVNKYSGFTPSTHWRPEVVDASIDPEVFFNRYIAQRVPVIISKMTDPLFHLAAWTELPDSHLYVEHCDKSQTFGTGVKSKMLLSELLDRFKHGEDGFYVTTQPLPEDSNGRTTSLYASPVTEMISHLPVRPLLMGRLVPSTINAWLGASRKGSSSNLHHDYHDNLYVLLSGRKRFTISCPALSSNMYPYGSISRVHPNGLINYGTNLTRGDGAVMADVLQYLQGKLRSARGEQQRSKATTQLNAAQLLAQELDDACPISDDDETVPSAASSTAAANDMWAALTRVLPAKKQQTARQATTPMKKKESKRDTSITRSAAASDSTSTMPCHFSQIDLPGIRLRSVAGAEGFSSAQQSPEIAARWPRFQDAALATFDLEAGQMLFLPAGWWHEVVSFAGDAMDTAPLGYAKKSQDGVRKEVHAIDSGVCGDASGGFGGPPTEATAGAKRKRSSQRTRSSNPVSAPCALPPGVHLALNWWFHPPTTADFKSPYTDSFWEHVFSTDVAQPKA
jgi:hypothetical protein